MNSQTRIGIIIQARMGSSRLRGKILKNIGEKTLLAHIIYRLSFLKHSADIVIATTNEEIDNEVDQFCQINKIKCFRGSESNVLERYYLCAEKERFDHIIRFTGDNPFVDTEEVDSLIDLHFVSKSDFTHAHNTLPIGVGVEIFTFEALARSYKEGTEPHHLEHVNEYLLENPSIFKTSTLTVAKSKNRPDVRLTVDTEDDYQKALYIVQNAKEEYITTEEAIELCSQYA